MKWLGLFILLQMPWAVAHAEYTVEELERWFNSDEFGPPRSSAEGAVNDGQLVFLEQAPADVHHHHNYLQINKQSLQSGWVRLYQCHENIDQVSNAQILFRKQRIRELEIAEVVNIQRVWIEGASVQMENIAANARLCVRAWSRALRSQADGSYMISSGPFMRRFLDGYYPMRLSMEIELGQSGLVLESMTPDELEGLNLKQEAGRLIIEALFEGRLRTELRFRKTEVVSSHAPDDHTRP